MPCQTSTSRPEMSLVVKCVDSGHVPVTDILPVLEPLFIVGNQTSSLAGWLRQDSAGLSMTSG